MKDSGIYSIKNLITNKRYIGYSVNLKSRKSSHFSELKLNKHRNNHLQNCFNKYGKHNFIFEILELCDVNLLPEREHFWVLFYKSYIREKGYNIQTTGILDKPRPMSQETKNKISKIHKGRKVSEKEKLRLLSCVIGKKHSPEHIKKVVESRQKLILERGYLHSEEVRKKMSDFAKIRGIPESTRIAQKLKVTGSENLSRRVKILQYDLEMNLIKEWNCALEASKYFNCTAALINHALKGKIKTAKKFIWKYA